MHDGPTHARERPPLAGAAGGRRPPATPNPIEELTELFLGSLPDAGPPLLDDDLPLPPLKPEAAERPARPAARPQPPAAAEPAVEPRPAAASPAPRTQRPIPEAPPRRIPVELVLVGHLPVAAAAWVHQFARHRQRRLHAPVALARWRGGSVSVDLHGEGVAFGSPPCSSLAEALEAAPGLASTLIVSVDETDELDIAALPGVERITALTGSHDTAVVACYRALKGLASLDAVREGRCVLGVAVLGGPEERSRAAAVRLEKTAGAYLSHHLVCEVSSDRIGAGRAMPLFVGPADAPPAAALRSLLPADAPAAPAHSSDASPAAPAARDLLGRFPALRSIETRCPFAPGVEFGVAEDGQLHAVASARTGVEVPRAVADLTTASAWVQVNAEVLRAAIPELARRAGVSPPREHLLTAEPKAVRGLLDSKLRLHAEAADGSLMDLN